MTVNWTVAGRPAPAQPAATASRRTVDLRSLRTGWPVLAGLVGVAVAWGLSFVVVKDAVSTASPATVVGWRFGIATAVLVTLRPRTLLTIDRQTLRSGALLGALLGSAFVLCTYGMRSVPVVTSAFIVGTTVVFTPVVAWLWLRQRVTGRTWFAVGLAVVGLALLTLRGASGGSGSLLILLAALLWAVHLCGLGRWVVPDRVYANAVVQMGTATLLAVLVSRAARDELRLPDATTVGQLAFLGGIATAAAFVTVTWAQTRVDATTTAILLTLEPVVGAAAAVVLGESLTASLVIGALTVLAASGLVVARSAGSVAGLDVLDPGVTQDGGHDCARSGPGAGPPTRRTA